MEGARMVPRRTASTLDMLRQLERKVLWLSTLHDPSRQPRGGPRRRAEGRRAPGLLRLARDADDGALFPRPAAGGSRGGQAACEPGVPRHPVPARQPGRSTSCRTSAPSAARSPIPRAPRTPTTSTSPPARSAWASASTGFASLVQDYVHAKGWSPELAQGAHDRADGRCRDRRGQRPRGPARILEARARELLVGRSTTTARASTRWCPTACS